MKLTKSILREIIKEVISEADQKFYARDPKGKKISVFTNKDNFQKAVKGGYKKVDREEAEKELAGQGKAPDKPKAKPKIVADPFADKTADTNNTNNLAWLQPDWVQQHVKDYMLDDNQITFGYDYDAGRAMIGALKNSGFKSGKDFELDYEMGDKPGRDNPSAIKILNPTMYQDEDLMKSMQNNLASDEGVDEPDEFDDFDRGAENKVQAVKDNAKKLGSLFNARVDGGGKDMQSRDEMESTLTNIFGDDELTPFIMRTPPEEFGSANDFIKYLMGQAKDRMDESIVSSLQKEFKQYDIINKNLTRG